MDSGTEVSTTTGSNMYLSREPMLLGIGVIVGLVLGVELSRNLAGVLVLVVPVLALILTWLRVAMKRLLAEPEQS